MKIKSFRILVITTIVLFGLGLLVYAQDKNDFGEEVLTVEGELICWVCKNINSACCKGRILESVYMKNGSKDIFAYTPENYLVKGSFDDLEEYWRRVDSKTKSKKMQVTIRGVKITEKNINRYKFLHKVVMGGIKKDNVVHYIMYELTIGEYTMKFN